MTPEELVEAVAGYAGDAKAIDLVSLEVREVLGYADYFVICQRQYRPPGEGDPRPRQRRSEEGPRPAPAPRRGPVRGPSWILLDYLDVVVHVMTPETREFYALERLWGEVPSKALAGSAILSRLEPLGGVFGACLVV